MKMNKQAGFTLVELVVVIAVLGVLAASALPRFVNVQSNARVAIGQGLAAALNSGASLARASWVAAGSVTTGTPTVSVDGLSIVINTVGTTPGYPSATAAGIGNVLQNLDSSKYSVSYNGNQATYTVDSRQNCTVSYNARTGVVNTTQLTVANCG